MQHFTSIRAKVYPLNVEEYHLAHLDEDWFDLGLVFRSI